MKGPDRQERGEAELAREVNDHVSRELDVVAKQAGQPRCSCSRGPAREPMSGDLVAELLRVAEENRDMLRTLLTAVPATRSARAQLRVELGKDAVISVTEAAEWLPWSDGAKDWIVNAGITFQRGRYRYVRWSDVLDALPQRDRPKKSPPRRRTRSRGANAGSRKVKASDLPRF